MHFNCSGFTSGRIAISGRRGGSAFANLMHVFAGRLTPEEIDAAASYYSSLPPASDGAPPPTVATPH